MNERPKSVSELALTKSTNSAARKNTSTNHLRTHQTAAKTEQQSIIDLSSVHWQSGRQWAILFFRFVSDIAIFVLKRDVKLQLTVTVVSLHRYFAPLIPVFTARRNACIASAVLAIAIPSVCPSVRLSHADIVSNPLHVARCSLHCQIAKCV